MSKNSDFADIEFVWGTGGGGGGLGLVELWLSWGCDKKLGPS